MTARHEAGVGLRFDQLHRRFKREVAADDVRLCALRACLEPLHGRRVLDLGCGKGRFAARLAESGAEVVGIDLSAAMLAEAEGLARVRGSARRLPFAAATFDAVVAVEVFEHLAAVDAVLREVRRVLQPGGVVVIVDKNAYSMNARRALAAQPGGQVDRRDARAGGCTRAAARSASAGSGPRGFATGSAATSRTSGWRTCSCPRRRGAGCFGTRRA